MENYQYKLLMYILAFSNDYLHGHLPLLLNISMVQVCVGKEKEAISDMLPYLRLGYVSDPSEMQSVISSQGPICPVSLSYYIHFYFKLYAIM